MSEKEYPFVVECSFCGNGLLRAMKCSSCESVAAICDECELMWGDVESVFGDPNQKSSGAFPTCCHCKDEKASWHKMDFDEMAEVGLEAYVTDMST